MHALTRSASLTDYEHVARSVGAAQLLHCSGWSGDDGRKFDVERPVAQRDDAIPDKFGALRHGGGSLTQTTADDVVGANIFVNCIACGGVQTPPAEAYLAAASEQQRNSLFQMSPLGRLGRPEQYAAVALFLAAEDH